MASVCTTLSTVKSAKISQIALEFMQKQKQKKQHKLCWKSIIYVEFVVCCCTRRTCWATSDMLPSAAVIWKGLPWDTAATWTFCSNCNTWYWCWQLNPTSGRAKTDSNILGRFHKERRHIIFKIGTVWICLHIGTGHWKVWKLDISF